MKNSTARQGAVKLTSQEQARIQEMKEAASAHPVQEGEKPRVEQQEVFSGIHTVFLQAVDPEGECLQYRLSLWREEGQPALDEVQAMAAAFFGTASFQILPDPKEARRVNVLGLFLPLPR